MIYLNLNKSTYISKVTHALSIIKIFDLDNWSEIIYIIYLYAIHNAIPRYYYNIITNLQ